jgi:hypothetical protein
VEAARDSVGKLPGSVLELVQFGDSSVRDDDLDQLSAGLRNPLLSHSPRPLSDFR